MRKRYVDFTQDITKFLPINKYVSIAIIFLAIIGPLAVVLRSIFTGNIPFWYDNARDMLLAWDNLSKPTLIGPPSGIPGIFYGPYWIWLLSVGLFFSKDPRISAIIVGFVPYFILFPYVLFLFRELFGRKILILVWLLFIQSVGINYSTYIWNPHIAPLLFLLLIWLMIFTQKKGKYAYLFTLFSGIVAGLVVNFHISLGIGILIGIWLYFTIISIIQFFHNRNLPKQIITEYVMTVFFFVLGVLLIFIPFLLFELRHGFKQIDTVIKAFTTYGGLVELKGLTKTQIIEFFFGRGDILLQINSFWIYIIEVVVFGYFFISLKNKKFKLAENEKRLGMLLVSLGIGILFIFLSARNPVWEYHFIGVEIIFILLIALIVSKIPRLTILLTVWVVWLLIVNIISNLHNFIIPIHTLSTLSTKEYIVDTIAHDAYNSSYAVFSYSPSIYQYEYTYLFKWRYNKDIPYDPGKISLDSKPIYVVIPLVSKEVKNGYINYRTPEVNYKTTKIWHVSDGTTIIKREKKT